MEWYHFDSSRTTQDHLKRKQGVIYRRKTVLRFSIHFKVALILEGVYFTVALLAFDKSISLFATQICDHTGLYTAFFELKAIITCL